MTQSKVKVQLFIFVANNLFIGSRPEIIT